MNSSEFRDGNGNGNFGEINSQEQQDCQKVRQFTYGVVREGVIAENFPQISAKFPQTFRRISAPVPDAVKRILYKFPRIFRRFSAEFPQTFRKRPFANDPISELLIINLTQAAYPSLTFVTHSPGCSLVHLCHREQLCALMAGPS